MRTGILGGTFDPIHIGHLAAARAAMDCAHLDRVLFVPSATPPHREPAEATAQDRLEMTRLATAGESRYEVSDLEIRRGGTSYTSDTVREMKRRFPQDVLFLILGWDAARLFATWHDPDVIRKAAWIVVVSRPGAGGPTASRLGAAGLLPARTVLCHVNTPDVSASEVRKAIVEGRAVDGWVPEAVAAYIAKHGLYRDNRDVG